MSPLNFRPGHAAPRAAAMKGKAGSGDKAETRVARPGGCPILKPVHNAGATVLPIIDALNKYIDALNKYRSPSQHHS
jgi:hypothetical protein